MNAMPSSTLGVLLLLFTVASGCADNGASTPHNSSTSAETDVRERERVSFDPQRAASGPTDADDDGLEAEVETPPPSPAEFRFLAWKLAWSDASRPADQTAEYATIRRGVAVLLHGLEQFPNEPTLLWELGNLIGSRIPGARDDVRRLFMEDESIHALLLERVPAATADDVRDWMLAPAIFEQATDAYLRQRSVELSMAPIVFCSYEARALVWRAELLTRRGESPVVIREAWSRAERAWEALGALEFSGVRLNDLPELRRAAKSEEDSATALRVAEALDSISRRTKWLERVERERTDEMIGLRRRIHAIVDRLSRRGLEANVESNARAELESAMSEWDRVVPDDFYNDSGILQARRLLADDRIEPIE